MKRVSYYFFLSRKEKKKGCFLFFVVGWGGGSRKPRPDDLPLFCLHPPPTPRVSQHHQSSSSSQQGISLLPRGVGAPTHGEREREREREREKRKKDMKNAGRNYLIVVYCRLSLLAAGCGAFRSGPTTREVATGGHRRDLIIAPSSRSSSRSSFSATVLRGKMWKRLEIEEGELLRCWLLWDFMILW